MKFLILKIYIYIIICSVNFTKKKKNNINTLYTRLDGHSLRMYHICRDHFKKY